MIISQSPRAYTIIETMVAVSLLMFGVAAAAALSNTIVQQEEINARTARAVNWQENAVRLYQLGIDGSAILDVLPVLPQPHTLAVAPITPPAGTPLFTNYPTGIPAPEAVNITLSFTSDGNSGQTRSSVMKALR